MPARRSSLILLLAACAAAPSAGVRLQALERPGACQDPAAAGAVPGDGLSDRLAIQAAIEAAAAGGTVCLGPGRWTLDRASVGSYDRFAALYTRGHGVTIRGAGPETVLELVGDQGAATTILLDVLPGAEHVHITELTLDLSGATNTDEQTHAIATSGTCAGATCLPIRDLAIDHVTFLHPRNTTTRKGDCVRLLGNTDATRLTGVRIAENTFSSCARSAIEIQRGVYDAVITGNVIAATKTPIDGEATGGPADIDARIVIAGNTFTGRPDGAGDAAISLTSMQGVAITGNTMDGGVTVYRSTAVSISGNSIASAARDTSGTIDVENACDGLAISGNAIARTGAAGPVVKLVPHSGVACSGATVAGNTITQGTAAWAIYLESVSRAAIASNLVTHLVAAPGMSAIYDRSVMAGAPVSALAITGNAIAGPVTYAVTLDASPATFGPGVVVTGNAATGTTFGLRCNNGPGFTRSITAAGNAIGPSAYGGATVNTGE